MHFPINRFEKCAAYFEQMYFGCWTKTKTAKSGKYPPPIHDQKGGGVYLPLFMGVLFALHQKPNKTKARTNADIKPDPLQV